MTGQKVRRAGMRWRLKVDDWLGHRDGYGTAHHVTSDPEMGKLPAGMISDEARAKADALAAAYSTTTVFPHAEFDELVVDSWLHVEGMDDGVYWMNVAGVTLWVTVDPDGHPTKVSVYGPHDYDEPVEGCTYKCDWTDDPGRAD
jgi:hypothetical protein